jgi:hypothetical protein
MIISLKATTDADSRVMKGGVDLNDKFQFWQSSGLLLGARHEHWQDVVRPTHGLPAMDDLLSVRHALRGRQGHSLVDVRRTTSGHGLCPTELPSVFRLPKGGFHATSFS